MKRIILLFVILLIVSCDVPGILILNNNSGAKAYYKMYLKSGANERIHNFELIELNDKQKIDLMFGLGKRWTNRRVVEFCSKIDSIKIITKHDTLTITAEKELQKYFKKRRKYLSRSIVEIEIK